MPDLPASSPKRPERSAPTEVPVTLRKGSHRWTFVCEPGHESTLLGRLAELARREDVPFDLFDAALVSHQLRRRLNRGLDRIDTTKPTSTT